MIWITIIVCIWLMLLGKAIADKVEDRANWGRSPFSKIAQKVKPSDPSSSYWGFKDNTAYRKHEMGKTTLMKKLYQTVLVGLTDIWHGANTVRHVATFAMIYTFSFALGLGLIYSAIVTVMCAVIFFSGFHLLYHFIFENKYSLVFRMVLLVAFMAGSFAITKSVFPTPGSEKEKPTVDVVLDKEELKKIEMERDSLLVELDSIKQVTDTLEVEAVKIEEEIKLLQPDSAVVRLKEFLEKYK